MPDDRDRAIRAIGFDYGNTVSEFGPRQMAFLVRRLYDREAGDQDVAAIIQCRYAEIASLHELPAVPAAWEADA